MNHELIKNVGLYCREFRMNSLNISLTDFSDKNNVNLKSVNAFEYGRANNIKYLFYYYNIATEEQKNEFAINLFKLL